MKVGFTGTRNGMTKAQHESFKGVIASLMNLGEDEFHDGDCVGADIQARKHVQAQYPQCKTHCHPPESDTWRANGNADVIYPVKPYLRRNRDIVMATQVLVATPKMGRGSGGTWYTIDLARKCHRYVIMIDHEGKVTVFNQPSQSPSSSAISG